MVAVIIVTALGVFMYVGMSGYAFNLSKIAESYYTNQNVADYWIYGNELTKLDEKKIVKLPSVKDIQSRISIQTESYKDKNVTISLHGISGDFNINKPDIISGRMFENNRECMLDASHAKAHNIDVGDKIELKIKGTEQKMTFTVSALINSPEYIYNVSGTELMPDSYKNGFVYVKEDALESMKELLSYNEINVTLNENADGRQFRRDIEQILDTRLINLLSFDDNAKASILLSQIKETKALSTTLPMLFFFISAFIMFSTMSRFVENNRIMIGTLKALGYSKLTIFTYFLSYAFIVVLLGVLLGVLPSGLITNSMLKLTSTSMILPIYTVNFDVTAIFKVLGLTTVICAGAAAIVCAREIKYTPAECMRPKPQKIGKVNFVERINLLWSKMSFVQKTITRNIIRNKMRLIMCVMGVAGCMAIIITALGMSDSTTKFMDSLYANMYRYDLQVMLKADTSTLEAERIKRLAAVDKAEYVMTQSIKASKADKTENTAINIMEDKISLMVLSDEVKDSMTMPEDGAIVSSTVAKKLDIHKGDIIDIVLVGKSNVMKIMVSDIKDNISGFNVSKSFWRKHGEGYSPSTIYIKTHEPTNVLKNTGKYDFILSVKSKGEVVESIESQMSTMNTMIFILILFGGVLALVVLYNLGIMNFYERMRELATLKVLGFMSKEIKVLVLRENTIFTCIGILFGMPLGVGLHSSMLSQSSTGDMTFTPFIKGFTFVYAAGLTFMFSLFVNMLLGKKLKQIDMLGALKSVE
jgi:ABC-type antimicrobial peptide transport system permease subunit